MSICRHCGQGALNADAVGPICPDCIEEGYAESAAPKPLANGISTAAAVDLLIDATFALDRVEAWIGENLSDEGARDWFGHVEPALERLRLAINEAEGRT